MFGFFSHFCPFYLMKKFTYNMVMVASAEEQWKKRLKQHVLKHLPELDCAIVANHTLMQLAIAEKVY
jgi:acetylornithine deacetylase